MTKSSDFLYYKELGTSALVLLLERYKGRKTILRDRGVARVRDPQTRFEQYMYVTCTILDLIEAELFARDLANEDRNPTTVSYFPDRVTVHEFIKIITDQNDLDAYIENMEQLEWGSGKHYPEEWIGCFASWMEMNEKDQDPDPEEYMNQNWN